MPVSTMSARDRGDRVMGPGAAAAAGVGVGGGTSDAVGMVGVVDSTAPRTTAASSEPGSSTVVKGSPNGKACSPNGRDAASPGDGACGSAGVKGTVDREDAGSTASAIGCVGTLLTVATNPPSLAFSTLCERRQRNHTR